MVLWKCTKCGSVFYSTWEDCEAEIENPYYQEQHYHGQRVWQKDWELCQQATPGPWYTRVTDDEAFMNARYVSVDRGPGWGYDDKRSMGRDGDPKKVIAITLLQYPCLAFIGDNKYNENTEFIAEAREALPYWLQRVRELEEVLKEVSDYFAYKCRSDCPFSLCEGRRCDLYPIQRKVRQVLLGRREAN